MIELNKCCVVEINNSKQKSGARLLTSTVPCRLWIKFNEEKTGRKARANFYNVMRNKNIDSSLTPIEPVTRQINTR
jgi:hypothetical protein